MDSSKSRLHIHSLILRNIIRNPEPPVRGRKVLVLGHLLSLPLVPRLILALATPRLDTLSDRLGDDLALPVRALQVAVVLGRGGLAGVPDAAGVGAQVLVLLEGDAGGPVRVGAARPRLCRPG